MLIDPLLTSLLLALCKNTFSLDSFPPFYNVSSVGGSTDQYEVLLGVYERKHSTPPTHDMFPVYKKINLVFKGRINHLCLDKLVEFSAKKI